MNPLRVLFVLLSFLLPQIVFGDAVPWRKGDRSASELPPEIADVGITEKLGNKLDLNLAFKDETGKTVKLGDYISGQKPVLLSIVYYGCPGLCNYHLSGVTEAIKQMDWSLGREFDMIVVSLEPTETPELANKKKQAYMASLGKPDAGSGWHFLVGSEASIHALARSVGFRYQWDKVSEQWAHTSAMYVVSPQAVISRYLYGIQFDPKTVRLSLVEASEGKIGSVMDHLILTCFQYNPSKRGYAFYAYNIVRWGSGITALILFSLILPIWIKERRRSRAQGVTT